MGLPVIALPRETVEVNGEKVEVRGLSRAEVFKMSQTHDDDADAAEVFLLAKGADVTEDEARAWREATDSTAVETVLAAIVRLSGLPTTDGKDPS